MTERTTKVEVLPPPPVRERMQSGDGVMSGAWIRWFQLIWERTGGTRGGVIYDTLDASSTAMEGAELITLGLAQEQSEQGLRLLVEPVQSAPVEYLPEPPSFSSYEQGEQNAFALFAAGDLLAGTEITLTGDVSGVGTGSVSTTLSTVNLNVGSFGSSTSIPSLTVNGKGLVTAASGNVVVAPAGTLTGATLAANVLASSLTSVGTLLDLTVTNPINGSITGSAGSASGNADSATVLATPRAINGVDFDGSAAITVTAAADTLTGATLAAGVTASSLTSVGTLTALDVTGAVTAADFVPTGSAVPVNGMYLPAANTVGIATNSTLGVTISSVGNIGIKGVALNSAQLHGYSDTSTAMLQQVASSLTAASAGSWQLRRSRGTVASPSPVLSGDRLGAFVFNGATDSTTGFASTASVNAAASENYDATHAGSALEFYTTNNASGTTRTLKATLDNAGNFGLGLVPSGTYTLEVSGAVSATGAISGSNLSGTNTGDTSTFTDAAFTLTDDGDPSKIAKFQLSGITAGQTRTYTLSNASGTIPTTNTGSINFNGTNVGWGTSTATNTISLGSGATLNGSTKTVNIGTAGVSGSTTNINIGSATSAGTITLNQALAGTTASFSGAVTGSNLSGTNTGNQTTITGNAGSATVLQTARAINGVNFDGSAAITVTAAAGTLTGATLASGVTASSLTSVGVLTGDLGVGISPTAGLHVNKDSGSYIAKFERPAVSGQRLALYNGVNAFYLDAEGTGNQLIFSTVGTERMRIDSAGNVGIGGASGGAKLDVMTAGGLNARVYNSANSDAAYFTAQNTIATTLMGSDATGSFFYTAQAVPILFYTSAAERLRIDADGNLIATVPTTSPTLTANSQMVFNLTSNTNLRISVRGTDGVTRTANITLA